MPKQYLVSLKCKDGCGREFPLNPTHICEYDFGPLRVRYDYERVRKDISRKKIGERAPDMWRYIEFLPIDADETPETSLSTGYTPLLKAKNLAEALGIEADVYIKDDTRNPTHSFKDRVVEMAVAKAKEFGYRKIACASTGNLGHSLAAHATKAGLECFVFIPSNLEKEKIQSISVYKPILVGIDGVYDEVNRLGSQISDRHKGIAFANINLRPYYGDGSKTFGFEIAEQLGWKAPAHVVAPVAGASLITKIYKAFDELYLAGLIEEPKTRMYAAQPSGCCPVANAILDDKNTENIIKPISRQDINTIAKSLAKGNPADGQFAAAVVKKSGGYAATVTDGEIVEGIKLLAETTGIWAETAGGVVIASAKKLIEQGKIPRNDGSVVLCITGAGYKTPDAVPDNGNFTTIIKPSIDAFDKFYKRLNSQGGNRLKDTTSLEKILQF